jgi:hypothetical protein
MWLHFRAPEPAALQVGIGKVCAISGDPWSGVLSRDPQNYVVLPQQPWLDGINSGKGTVRQFVAVPLGMGATVEGQVTGEETTGGIQLQARELKPGPLAEYRKQQAEALNFYDAELGAAAPGGYAGMPAPAAPGGFGGMPAPAAPAMGVGAGGTMRQDVYEDDRPLSDWEAEPAGRVFVHLVPPPLWRELTGEQPPPSPVDRAAYTRAGLPWFDYYDEDGTDLAPADGLAEVKPVGEWLGDDHEPWTPPKPEQVKHLGDAPGKPAKPGKEVRDGEW